ncbi:hypothetical protein Kfla_0275 [Kribbella flavida DSM 17836]|uniref:PH domain-containing protein n=1 Tax=Kribbella flavida (strain DSM 17836 / JCM 10339 / NBRC 14399) TaxID=479435 RepID=D2PT83_KRIFD|nr:hypothetical protein [Kribbella flavida]ADB29399.1 hypothetical protein Kfla_0275 [Kribbella flavida DSM 17836]
MRTTYRMRAGRFLGILAVGLILFGVAAIAWAVGLPDAVVGVFAVLGGLVALAGLWVLARPPVLLKLGEDRIEVRGLKTEWTDVTEVGRVATTHGEAIALRTKHKDGSILIPLRWLAPGRTEQLEQELRERLNTAHGYTIWDGTAGPADDRAE